GRLGGLLAGLGFLLPGLLLMLAASWAWTSAGQRAWIPAAVLACLQAAVAALVARAALRLGRGVVVDGRAGALVASALAASWAGAPFWLVLGLPGLGLSWRARAGGWLAVGALVSVAGLFGLHLDEPPGGRAHLVSAAVPGASELLGVGLRAGLFSFGGAYAAVPLVREVAVVQHGWLTDGQFLDGLALGGVLPEPLIVFTTFVGYAAAGLPGALAATVGTFLPAFALTLLLHERLERWMELRALHGLLDGVMLGVVGLVSATALQVGQVALRAPLQAGVAAGALLLLVRLPATWGVPAVMALVACVGGLVTALGG
ncbi:MAG: chromate transporter, partial [Deltaproteobacteria bacterium]|nr:chromate transporter [Deltaproteobacteria bacterium]